LDTAKGGYARPIQPLSLTITVPKAEVISSTHPRQLLSLDGNIAFAKGVAEAQSVCRRQGKAK
jgi:hypothetical protein